MTLTPRAIADAIVSREGGFVNDPDDPGGATNYGVTIHTMRRLKIDVDKDGDIDTADVRKLTKQQAVDIFLIHYFERPKIDRLPECIQASVFDMNVNAGTNAMKILQRVLNDMFGNIAVDGVIGPQTIEAAQRAASKSEQLFVDAYGIARRNYYFSLADRRPKSRKYARTRAGGKGGWITRAEEFMSPRFHMTNAQFKQRVAAWG